MRTLSLASIMLGLIMPAFLCLSCAGGGQTQEPPPRAVPDLELGRYQALNAEDYNQFIRLRCLDLGQALIDLSSSDAERKEIARLKLNDIRQAERRKGRIIPREIEKQLAKSSPDMVWLGIRGKLLVAAYDFESNNDDAWEMAAAKMKALGRVGDEFLAAQMIKRLANSQASVRERATYLLAEIVDRDVSIPLLVDVTAIEISGQPKVFPARVVEVLVKIGASAVPGIIDAFNVNGKFVPAGLDWKRRQYLVIALGAIGDKRGSDVLIEELKQLSIPESNPGRFVYEHRLVEALGELEDERAVAPIVAAWKKEEGLALYARRALLKITGTIYDSPDSHR